MSRLYALVQRIARAFGEPRPFQADIDAMSLRQWADLPPYHPIKDSRAG